MRIFALSALLLVCLSSEAQQNTSEATSTRLVASTKDASAQAAIIVEKFYAGSLSPSPVTPPMVESIEKEMKRKNDPRFPVSGRRPMQVKKKVNTALFEENTTASMAKVQAIDPVTPPARKPVAAEQTMKRAEPEQQVSHAADAPPAVKESYTPPPAHSSNRSTTATPVAAPEKERKKPFAGLFGKHRDGPLKRLFRKKDREISPAK